MRSSYLSEFFQDDWKASPRLTLNLGLRFEYEGPNAERNQKANTFFDFNAVNPISAGRRELHQHLRQPVPHAKPRQVCLTQQCRQF